MAAVKNKLKRPSKAEWPLVRIIKISSFSKNTRDVLQPSFEAIWDKKQLPDDLTEGVIVKIP